MPPSGAADSPICQSTVGGYTHYSATIRYNPGIGKREDQSDVQTSDVQTSDAGKDVALEKRQDFVVLGFALVAGGYSATFITDAIDTCGALEIDSKNVEYGSCAAKAGFGTLFGFISAYEVYTARQGVRQTPAGTRGRRDLTNLGDLGEEFHSLMTPYTVNGLVAGYSSIFDHPINVTGHDGEQWTQWTMNHTHHESGTSFGSWLRHHPVSPIERKLHKFS